MEDGEVFYQIQVSPDSKSFELELFLKRKTQGAKQKRKSDYG